MTDRLPLELFQDIIYRLSNDVGPLKLMPLRQVSSFWDQEMKQYFVDTVLSRSETRQALLPDPDRILPSPASYVDFVAAILFMRPFDQSPWNANISSHLNHVLDCVLINAGLGPDDANRKPLLRTLCRYTMELHNWSRHRFWLSSQLFPESGNKRFIERSESLEFNVLLAEIILNRRTTLSGLDLAVYGRRSFLFGTLLQACVGGRQFDLVKTIMDTGVDINHPDQGVMEAAMHSDCREALHTLLNPPFSLQLSRHKYKNALVRSLVTDRPLITKFLLQNIPESHWLSCSQKAFMTACKTGHVGIVESLDKQHRTFKSLDWYRKLDLAKNSYGHRNIMSFLVEKGVSIINDSMEDAMVNADLHTAIFMVIYGPRRLELGAWKEIDAWKEMIVRCCSDASDYTGFTYRLIQRGCIDFQKVISTYCERWVIRIMESACAHGDAALVRDLVEFCRVPFKLYELGAPHLRCSPMLIARAKGQENVVKTLLELGAAPIEELSAQDLARVPDFPRRDPIKKVLMRPRDDQGEGPTFTRRNWIVYY